MSENLSDRGQLMNNKRGIVVLYGLIFASAAIWVFLAASIWRKWFVAVAFMTQGSCRLMRLERASSLACAARGDGCCELFRWTRAKGVGDEGDWSTTHCGLLLLCTNGIQVAATDNGRRNAAIDQAFMVCQPEEAKLQSLSKNPNVSNAAILAHRDTLKGELLQR
jgi:hypothetical protein